MSRTMAAALMVFFFAMIAASADALATNAVPRTSLVRRHGHDHDHDDTRALLRALEIGEQGQTVKVVPGDGDTGENTSASNASSATGDTAGDGSGDLDSSTANATRNETAEDDRGDGSGDLGEADDDNDNDDDSATSQGNTSSTDNATERADAAGDGSGDLNGTTDAIGDGTVPVPAPATEEHETDISDFQPPAPAPPPFVFSPSPAPPEVDEADFLGPPTWSPSPSPALPPEEAICKNATLIRVNDTRGSSHDHPLEATVSVTHHGEGATCGTHALLYLGTFPNERLEACASAVASNPSCGNAFEMHKTTYDCHCIFEWEDCNRSVHNETCIYELNPGAGHVATHPVEHGKGVLPDTAIHLSSDHNGSNTTDHFHGTTHHLHENATTDNIQSAGSNTTVSAANAPSAQDNATDTANATSAQDGEGGEEGSEEGEDGEERPGLWTRLLFGFWPSAITLILCLLVCVRLHLQWDETGALGFNSMSGLEAVRSGIQLGGPLCFLLFRLTAAAITTCVPIDGVLEKQKEAGDLPLGGLRVLGTFTIWTWVGMSLYFLQASAVTAWYQLTNSSPSPAYAAVLWVWFEVMYAMAWLVFLLCWVGLVPAAHFGGQKDVVAMLLSPRVLVMHNANLVIMQLELLFSDWTMQQDHVIFCIYFGITYIIFNWWLRSQTGKFSYFFLDYDRAGVPSFLVLLLLLYGCFQVGVLSADFVK